MNIWTVSVIRGYAIDVAKFVKHARFEKDFWISGCEDMSESPKCPVSRAGGMPDEPLLYLVLQYKVELCPYKRIGIMDSRRQGDTLQLL